MNNFKKKAAGWYPAASQDYFSKHNGGDINKNPFRKPLPPYGGKLLAQIAEGMTIKNDIWLFFGQGAWQYAVSHINKQAVLALPYGENAEKYTWPVMGFEIFAIDCAYLSKQSVWATEENYIRKLAFVLLSAGSCVVRVICWNGSMVVYRRDCK